MALLHFKSTMLVLVAVALGVVVWPSTAVAADAAVGAASKTSARSFDSFADVLLAHPPVLHALARRAFPEESACIQALAQPRYWSKILTASGLTINSLGDYEHCVHNYDMRYCILDGHSHQLAQGLCFPPQCTEEDISSVVHAAFSRTPQELEHFMDENVKPLWDKACEDTAYPQQCISAYPEFREDVSDAYTIVYEADPSVHCGTHHQVNITAGFIVMLIVCAIILFLAVFQACRETRVLQGFTDEEKQMLIVNDNSINSDTDRNYDNAARCELLFRAFSVKKNTAELLSSSSARTLKSLEGLRSISMFGIILGHTINFQLPGFIGVQNPEAINDELTSWSGQFLISQNFAVDTFFVLSGLLTAYVFIRKHNAGRKIPVFMGMLLRYLRVTPLLAFIVGAYACFFRYFGKGPLWYRFLDELDNCKTNWWQHLLYINNFVPTDYKKQCVPWAWYLADDMQFSIIGLLLLGLYRYSRKAMYFLTTLLLLCGPIATGLVSSYHGVTLTEGDSQNLIYDKPYTRCSAYAIGLLCGCLLANKTEYFRNLPALTGVLSLLISVAGILTIMYITAAFNWSSGAPNWSDTGMYVYQALSRPAWAVFLCMLIVTCTSGYGYAINWLLTLPFWEPLGRLTFAAYLIHPALIRMVYYQRVQLFQMNPVEYSTFFVAFLTAAYVVGGVLFVFVEQPSAVLISGLKGKR